MKLLCDVILVLMMLAPEQGTRPPCSSSFRFRELMSCCFRWEGWKCYVWLSVFFALSTNVLVRGQRGEADVVELVDTLL